MSAGKRHELSRCIPQREEAAEWDALLRARALEPEALTAAVVAAIRHNHTRYDQLLMSGWSRIDARDVVRDVIEQTIESWLSPPGRC